MFLCQNIQNTTAFTCRRKHKFMNRVCNNKLCSRSLVLHCFSLILKLYQMLNSVLFRDFNRTVVFSKFSRPKSNSFDHKAFQNPKSSSYTTKNSLKVLKLHFYCYFFQHFLYQAFLYCILFEILCFKGFRDLKVSRLSVRRFRTQSQTVSSLKTV